MTSYAMWKLLMIREHLNFTQQQMIEKIYPDLDSTARAIISQYERGERIPSLGELIEYANLADTTIDCLVKDELDLEFK